MRAGIRDVLAVLSTGGGKTVVAGFMAKETAARGRRFWFLCHRDFLIEQTALTFQALGIDFGFIAAGRKYEDKPVMIVGIDTVKRRLAQLEPPDVMVWDEAHHLRAAGWEAVHAWAEGAYNIGLTATPERLDGKGLDPPFKAMVLGPDTRLLIDEGHLSRYRAYGPSTVDRDRLHDGQTAGEYNAREMETEVREKVIVGDILETFRRLTAGLPEPPRAVYFCPSIAYSQDLAAAFSSAGIPALHVDGTSPSKERKAAALALASGEAQVLCNVALMGEGFDLAAQAGRDVTLNVVGQLRPTMSLALHRQQVGRALRPKPYPAILIDHVGNLQEHGLPDEPIEWRLDWGEAGRRVNAGVSRVKLCKHCGAANPVSARICSECETLLLSPVSPPRVVKGTLEELSTADTAAARRAREIKRQRQNVIDACRSYEDFARAAEALGYKRAWAHFRWEQFQKAEAAATRRAEDQYRAYREGRA